MTNYSIAESEVKTFIYELVSKTDTHPDLPAIEMLCAIGKQTRQPAKPA